MTMRLVMPARYPLRGTTRVPGDKSVTHRSILFAPLTQGVCRVLNRLQSEDTDRSLAAIRGLGAVVQENGDELMIEAGEYPAPGAAMPQAPVIEIYCGNSGTTTRLLMGLLAGRQIRVRLDGDDSLRSRPMARVGDPLRAMGADIRYLGKEGRLPLEITGVALRGTLHQLAVASAQVKSALLLAGLDAAGETNVCGGAGSRDHTERLLKSIGADLNQSVATDCLTIKPGTTSLNPYDMTVPGDPSSAAFLAAAASLIPGSELTLADILANPSRIGFFTEYPGDLSLVLNPVEKIDPTGTIKVSAGRIKACRYGGETIPAMIDEIPMLAVLAARAEGVTRIADAEELRYKESDRISATIAGLQSLGVEVEEHADGMSITGCPDGFPSTEIARIKTRGDHRIAMAFAVAGLASRAGVELDDDACIAVSFPEFFELLDTLQQSD